MSNFLKILNASAIHISNFLKILVVLLLILLLSQQQRIYDANWCSSEISIIKEQISSMYFMYGLDELTIEKGK